MLLILLALSVANSVGFEHPSCGMLVASKHSQVKFHLQNRCANNYGMILDFSPTFDSACRFDTCIDSETSGNWQYTEDASVKGDFPNFAEMCGPNADPETLFMMPIRCETNETAPVEQFQLRQQVVHGYTIEFRRNWWTSDGYVGLEFVTHTLNGKIASLKVIDENIGKALEPTVCTELHECEQIWPVILYRSDTKSFDMQIRISTPRGIIKEVITANVEVVPGQASEWQRGQIVDAMLFSSPKLEVPIYDTSATISDKDELCVVAVAPHARSMTMSSARLCHTESGTCKNVGESESSNTNSSMFCFEANKRHESDEHTIEVDYTVESALNKRSWSSTLTTVNGTVIKTRWIVIVKCPDGTYWSGSHCAFDDDGWWHHHDADDHHHDNDGFGWWFVWVIGGLAVLAGVFVCLIYPWGGNSGIKKR